MNLLQKHLIYQVSQKKKKRSHIENTYNVITRETMISKLMNLR